MNRIKLSVLMPVYNNQEYLAESIESILNQTFTDFELLIFNDGSTDNSSEIINGFTDPRIIFYEYKENKGYIYRLNKGIAIAKGEYIARMDGDDISLPTRFEKQIDFMEHNLEVGLCGTQVITIGTVKGYISYLPLDNEKIQCALFFFNSFAHSSIMIRKSVLINYGLSYNPLYYPSEDYKLWLDIGRYSQLRNIPEILLKYRVHNNQVSQIHSELQYENLKKIYKEQFSLLGIYPTDDEFEVHSAIYRRPFNKTHNWTNKAGSWLLRLKKINSEKRIFHEPIFSQVLAEKWFYLCAYRRRMEIWFWKTFFEWPLRNWSLHLSIPMSIKLLLKEILQSRRFRNEI